MNADIGRLTKLSREMEFTARFLESLPDDREWDQAELASVEDVRRAALDLVREAEAILNSMTGG
jgi:hypothetical protein